MLKKLAILIQTLAVLGSMAPAYADNMTVDIYENGQHKGTMTIPESRYQDLANGMKGTGVTVRPQPRPDAAARQQAAQQRMEQWRKEAEQRRAAALAQQEKWNQDFQRRHDAAQRGFDAWKAAR